MGRFSWLANKGLRLAILVAVIVGGAILGRSVFHQMALSYSADQVALEKKDASIEKKQKKLLGRSNEPAAIDAEFAARMAAEKAAAHKLVRVDGDQITVKHKFGTTVMPKEHQRIVVIRMEDPMVALDVPFIGGNYTDDHYLAADLKARGVTVISVNDDSKTINYEQVQSLQPDLIIMRDSFDKSVYDKLNQIAPTAAFNLRQHEVSLLAVAYALGIPDKGEARLAAFYDKAKFYRMVLADHLKGGKVAHLRVLNKEVRLYPYSTNDISRFMYEKLNLIPPEMVLEADYSTTNSAISFEQLPDLDADYLIISAGYGPSSKENPNIAKARLASMQADALWQFIPAVKEGHVMQVDTSLWNAHGIIQEEKAMEDIYRAWGQ